MSQKGDDDKWFYQDEIEEPSMEAAELDDD